MYQVDLNLLVGVMTFTFSPLHCFYATIVEGGAADRRRRPILVKINILSCTCNTEIVISACFSVHRSHIIVALSTTRISVYS